MPIRTQLSPTLTPRERAELDWEKEYARIQVEYAQKASDAQVELERIKANHELVLKKLYAESSKLKIEHEREIRAAEVAIKRMEIKWLAILRIPQNIVLLPVKLIMAFAIPISAISGKQVPEKLWEMMKW